MNGLCNSSAHGKNLQYPYTFQILYASFSYAGPGIRHTYKFHVSFVRIAPGPLISYIFAEQKTRQKDSDVLYLPPSQGLDSGKRPFFAGFSHLGNLVDQHWCPYEVYPHFLWHHVSEIKMREPQSGTITCGLIVIHLRPQVFAGVVLVYSSHICSFFDIAVLLVCTVGLRSNLR